MARQTAAQKAAAEREAAETASQNATESTETVTGGAVETTSPAPAEVTTPATGSPTSPAPAEERGDVTPADAGDAPPTVDDPSVDLAGDPAVVTGAAATVGDPVTPPEVPEAERKAARTPTDVEKAAEDPDPVDLADVLDTEAEVTVVMSVNIGGTRDGKPWPKVGKRITLPLVEALGYVRSGYCRPVHEDSGEAFTDAEVAEVLALYAAAIVADALDED